MEKEIFTIKKKVKIHLIPLIQINENIKEFKKEKQYVIEGIILKNKKEKFIDDDEDNKIEIIDIIKNFKVGKKNKDATIENNKDFEYYNNENVA